VFDVWGSGDKTRLLRKVSSIGSLWMEGKCSTSKMISISWSWFGQLRFDLVLRGAVGSENTARLIFDW